MSGEPRMLKGTRTAHWRKAEGSENVRDTNILSDVSLLYEENPIFYYISLFIEKVLPTHIYIWQIVAKNTNKSAIQVTRPYININSVRFCEQTKYKYK